MTARESGAVFSQDRKYRYVLWRTWANGSGRLAVIGLNPSTADEDTNDPTVERCVRRARQMGFRSLVMLNIFAFRSTDPRGLLREASPIQAPGSSENDLALKAWTAASGPPVGYTMPLCAWGRWGRLNNRHNEVCEMLADRELFALKINKDGTPQHPLYLSYDIKPFTWRPFV